MLTKYLSDAAAAKSDLDLAIDRLNRPRRIDPIDQTVTGPEEILDALVLRDVRRAFGDLTSLDPQPEGEDVRQLAAPSRATPP